MGIRRKRSRSPETKWIKIAACQSLIISPPAVSTDTLEASPDTGSAWASEEHKVKCQRANRTCTQARFLVRVFISFMTTMKSGNSAGVRTRNSSVRSARNRKRRAARLIIKEHAAEVDYCWQPCGLALTQPVNTPHPHVVYKQENYKVMHQIPAFSVEHQVHGHSRC